MTASRLCRLAAFGLLAGIWYAVINVAWLVLSTGARPATRQFNAVTYGDLTLLFDPEHALDDRISLEQFAS